MSQTGLALPSIAAQSTGGTLTTPEVAALLKISLRTANRLSATGAIPGQFRIGRCVRFGRRQVVDWLDRGCPMPSLRGNVHGA
jgi:excisionase family DNA binding protein